MAVDEIGAEFSSVFLRIALGGSFLSAVADRFGLWGAYGYPLFPTRGLGRVCECRTLGREEALDLFRSDDLIGIGMAADAVRRKLHPEGIVSYIIDRNINYTNFCTE